MHRDRAQPNPFDFRLPVRKATDLVGRRRELRWLGSALERLQAAEPSHALLVGPGGWGKTSVLNVFAEAADESTILPVQYRLNDSCVSSPEAFFDGLLSAAVLALRRRNILPEDDPRYLHWRRQVARLDSDLPFILSLAQPYCDAAILAHDCRTIAAVAREDDRVGVLALIDDAHLIRDDAATLQAMASLLEDLTNWSFVFTGRPRVLDDLAESAPALRRKLETLLLTPILQPADVTELLLGPLSTSFAADVDIDFLDVLDVAYASVGQPRALKLLAHMMWHFAEEDPASYALTTKVLDAALSTEVQSFPRDALPEHLESRVDAVRRIRDLATEELRELVPLVSMEEMTLQECALAVLATKRTDRGITTSAAGLQENLDDLLGTLEDREVLARNEDRFSFSGGAFARAYLRREIIRRTDQKPDIPEPSYGSFISARFFERMTGECGFREGDSLITGFRNRGRMDDDEAFQDQLGELAQRLTTGDPFAFENSQLVSLYSSRPPSAEQGAIVLLGISLSIGMDETLSLELERIQIGALYWSSQSVDATRIRERVHEWFGERESLLADYRIRFLGEVVSLIDPRYADQLVAVSAPNSVISRVMDYYERDALSDCVGYLNRVLPPLELRYAEDNAPDTRAYLSDAYQRLGFIAALIGAANDAQKAIRRSHILGAQSEFLNSYNLAFVRASRGEYAAAADLARQAHEEAPADAQAYMLLFLPRVDGWIPRSRLTETAWVEGERTARLIAIQAVVYDALAGRFDLREFARALDDVTPKLGGPELRLAGWTFLGRYGAVDEAVRAFEAAVSAGAEEASGEREFAELQRGVERSFVGVTPEPPTAD